MIPVVSSGPASLAVVRPFRFEFSPDRSIYFLDSSSNCSGGTLRYNFTIRKTMKNRRPLTMMNDTFRNVSTDMP